LVVIHNLRRLTNCAHALCFLHGIAVVAACRLGHLWEPISASRTAFTQASVVIVPVSTIVS
jgi:hypothetical protein